MARYKPYAQRREIRDSAADGLILIVHPTGAKSWAMRFRRPSGRLAKLTLGTVDAIGQEQSNEPEIGGHHTLAAARRLASKVQRDRKMGVDVVANRSAAKTEETITFADAAANFVTRYCKKQHSRWTETARVLGLDPDKDLVASRGGLAYRWRDRPVGDISGRDIALLLTGIVDRGAPHSANRMLATLRKMFGWLGTRHEVVANPCAGIPLPTGVVRRDRFLSDDEIKAFWQAVGDLGEPWTSFFRVLLLTGQRRDEVARMPWAEIDGTTWTIPKERAKNRTAHIVPLAPMVADIITGIPRIEHCPYVFSTNGETPISGFSKIKARLDRTLDIPPWRIHDLRRTAATGMARLGVGVAVVEKILNHTSGTHGGIVGVYQRYDYAAEKRAALTAWADLVQQLVESQDEQTQKTRTFG